MYLPDMNSNGEAFVVCEFIPSGMKEFNIYTSALYETRWEVKKAEKAKLPERSTSSQIEYFINLEIIKIAARKIKVRVKTDFPDNTNLYINVSREYYEQGESEAYSGDIFMEDFSVINGKIEVEVNVDDSIWLAERSAVNRIIGISTRFSKVAQNIEVKAVFSPWRKQQPEVLRILGKDGEFIKGVGANSELGFTTLSVTKVINIPFKE
jgi:hypothetical protein